MDLFSLMSSYLTRMTGILTSHGGTLDKYIGDAVMGFF
jgi:class 3 adenylate cyclase